MTAFLVFLLTFCLSFCFTMLFFNKSEKDGVYPFLRFLFNDFCHCIHEVLVNFVWVICGYFRRHSVVKGLWTSCLDCHVAFVWLIFGYFRRHWRLEVEDEEEIEEKEEWVLEIEEEEEIKEEEEIEEEEEETSFGALFNQKAFATLEDLPCAWDFPILVRDLHLRKQRRCWQNPERKQLLSSLVDLYLAKISEEKREPPRVMED
jgi:hypothetical protein